MFIQIFFIGFTSSWKESLLPSENRGSSTTPHSFRVPGQKDAEWHDAQEILSLHQQQKQSSSNSKEKLEAEKRDRKTPQLIFLQALAAETVDYDGRKDLDVATEEKLRILSEDPAIKDLAKEIRMPSTQSREADRQLDLQVSGIKTSLNSQVPEVRRAACKRLEGIVGSYGTKKLPIEWAELVSHHHYQEYLQGLQKKHPLNAASSQSKPAKKTQEETAAAAQTQRDTNRKKQAGSPSISILDSVCPSRISRDLGSADYTMDPETEIRQEWAEAIKALEEENLDDDALEGHRLMINADYHCQLGELFENLKRPEEAKRQYQKATLAYWMVEDRYHNVLKIPSSQEISQYLNQNEQFLKIYKNTVEKCRKTQNQYSVPAYYAFSGACKNLIEAYCYMQLEAYEEAAAFLQFFENYGPDWRKIDPSKYEKKCKKWQVQGSSPGGKYENHKNYYNKILKKLRENEKAQKAYDALKAQNRRDFWTLGVGGAAGMTIFCAGMLLLVNYLFLQNSSSTGDANSLTNPFGGTIDNVTESLTPGSNFSNYLQEIIGNATFNSFTQPQNVSMPDPSSTTGTPSVFGITTNAPAPFVQTCTDLARCMLGNATFVAVLNQYLLDPACGSNPAQFLHNLTCGLIGKYYQYTQAVNMMCVLVKLQESAWVGVCAPTLPEIPNAVPYGTCLEPGPIPPVRYSSVNLEIHRSKGFCATKRQANSFIPTETRELTMSQELSDSDLKLGTLSEQRSPSQSKRSGTRDDSASHSNSQKFAPPHSPTHLRSTSQSDSLSRSWSLSRLIGSRFYWANVNDSSIRKANIDPVTWRPINRELILQGGALISPLGFWIDEINDMIYFGNYLGYGVDSAIKVGRINHTARTIENITTLVTGIKSPYGLFVDTINGFIYFNEVYYDTGRPIRVARINPADPQPPTNIQDLVGWTGQSTGIYIDHEFSHIYFAESTTNSPIRKIYVATINSKNPTNLTNITLLMDGFLNSIQGFSVDLRSSKIFFRTLGSKVYMAAINRTNPTGISNLTVFMDADDLDQQSSISVIC